jgi:hypothetical protein
MVHMICSENPTSQPSFEKSPYLAPLDSEGTKMWFRLGLLFFLLSCFVLVLTYTNRGYWLFIHLTFYFLLVFYIFLDLVNDSFIPTLYFCILCLLLNCFLFLYIFGLLFLGCGLRWCVCYILANCFSGLVVSPEERSSWLPKLSVCVWILGTIKEVLANFCDIIHCKATAKNLSYNQKGLSQSNDITFQHNQSVFWLNWSRHKSPFIRFDCSALLNRPC